MTQTAPPPFAFADIESAAERLQGVAHRTPVMTSRTFNERVGAEVFFKCENFQRIGAFKFRGAYNALSRLSEDEKARGVVTFSSGNHAQAVALAGKLLNIRTVIVMPRTAVRAKLDATRAYGAEVVEHDPSETAREQVTHQIAEDEKLVLIPPFDHPHIAAGQGTAAKELIEEVGPLDTLVVPVGGGGLISGCAVAAKAMSPNCTVIGVEPEASPDAMLSLKARKLISVEVGSTIADGARTPSLGKDVTLPTLLRTVDQVVTISDEQIINTMRFMWERMKLVIEPTGTMAAAALLQGVLSQQGRCVGVIISGGNVDLNQALTLFHSLP